MLRLLLALALWCGLAVPSNAMFDCMVAINNYVQSRPLGPVERATLARHEARIAEARAASHPSATRFGVVDRYTRQVRLQSGDEVIFTGLLNREGRLVEISETDIYVAKKAGEPTKSFWKQLYDAFFGDPPPGRHEVVAASNTKEVAEQFRAIRRDLANEGFAVLILRGKRVTGGRIANPERRSGVEFDGQYYLRVFDLEREFAAR